MVDIGILSFGVWLLVFTASFQKQPDHLTPCHVALGFEQLAKYLVLRPHCVPTVALDPRASAMSATAPDIGVCARFQSRTCSQHLTPCHVALGFEILTPRRRRLSQLRLRAPRAVPLRALMRLSTPSKKTNEARDPSCHSPTLATKMTLLTRAQIAIVSTAWCVGAGRNTLIFTPRCTRRRARSHPTRVRPLSGNGGATNPLSQAPGRLRVVSARQRQQNVSICSVVPRYSAVIFVFIMQVDALAI
jgi:hypothetical protein